MAMPRLRREPVHLGGAGSAAALSTRRSLRLPDQTSTSLRAAPGQGRHARACLRTPAGDMPTALTQRRVPRCSCCPHCFQRVRNACKCFCPAMLVSPEASHGQLWSPTGERLLQLTSQRFVGQHPSCSCLTPSGPSDPDRLW